MNTLSLDIIVKRQKLTAYYAEDIYSEKWTENSSHSLIGDLWIRSNMTKGMVEIYRDRKGLKDLFDNMIDLDESFFAEVPREDVAGYGTLLGEKEYQQYGNHMFVIVVPEKTYRRVVKYADLVINRKVGHLKVLFDIPRRFANDMLEFPSDSPFPIVAYYFQYDSLPL